MFILAHRSGVFRVPLASGSEATLVDIDVNAGGPGVVPERLAVSDRWLVVGARVRAFLWRDSVTKTTRRQAFGAIKDLDVRGNRIVALGLQLENKRWAPDGTIAWVGFLAGDRVEFQPVLKTSARQVGYLMNCFPLDLGAVRFLPDGNFVVAPGVEPVLYLFDHSGQRIRTWKGSEVPFEGCTVTPQQTDALAPQDGRAAWSNQRRLLDDLIALPGGFGVIVRYWKGKEVRWDLLRYRARGGPVERMPIPVTSDRPYARLRADARANRLALLIVDSGGGRGEPSISKPLVIVELNE